MGATDCDYLLLLALPSTYVPVVTTAPPMALIEDLCDAYDDATPDAELCQERGMAAVLRALAEHILDAQFRGSARNVAEMLLREAQQAEEANAVPAADMPWHVCVEMDLDPSLSPAERNPSLVRR